MLLFKYDYLIVQLTLLCCLIITTACSEGDTTSSQIVQVSSISIHPQVAEFRVGEETNFSVFALTATGDTIDTNEIDIEWQWWSSNPDVFTVEAGGLATGQNQGEAFCIVEATVVFSEGEIPDIDVMYATIGADRLNQNRTMKLKAEVAEFYKSENVAMKKRLRFTGRDSAFVFVF